MIAWRSIAWAIASRTRMSSNGALALFMARMVSPSVVPTMTGKRGSAANCARFSGAGKFGKASTSPASIAAKAAVGSEMNLKVTLSSFAGVAPVVGVLHQLDVVALHPVART